MILPAVFRSSLPEDRAAVGRAARRRSARPAASTRGTFPRSTTSSAPSRARRATGDLVVVMSNGGFDDIHQKLLTALEARAAAEPMIDVRIVPAGDAALLVELPERIDPAINARCVALAARGRERAAAGASATSSSATASVTVYFDPLHVDAAWLEEQLRGARRRDCRIDADATAALDRGPGLLRRRPRPGSRRTSRAFGELLGRRGRSTLHIARDVPRLSSSASCPGSPTWRRSIRGSRCRAARRRGRAVPAGSVAIAGGQTGIYPTETPGGWHLIGRTPVQAVTIDRAPSRSSFKPGDRVRFRRDRRATSSTAS